MQRFGTGALAPGSCIGISTTGQGVGKCHVVVRPELSAAFGRARVAATPVTRVIGRTGHAGDRRGAKRIFLTGIACPAGGLLLAAGARQRWQFQPGPGVLAGPGLAAPGPVPGTARVPGGADRRLGAIRAGAGLGVLRTAPLAQERVDRPGSRQAAVRLLLRLAGPCR